MTAKSRSDPKGQRRSAKVTSSGAKIAMPKQAVPTIDWLAYCKDTEGNIFGLMQNDPQAK